MASAPPLLVVGRNVVYLDVDQANLTPPEARTLALKLYDAADQAAGIIVGHYDASEA